VKKSSRLQNAEGPKNTFPELVAEKRLKYSRREVAHHTAGSGPPFSGCGRLGDSPSHLQHYINRRVGVKLPQHSLPLHCYAVEKFDHSRSFFITFPSELSLWISFVKRGSFIKTVKNISFVKTTKKSIRWPEYARLRG
jgi:hypothetical protein